MKFPPYCERTRTELQAAVRWAQRKLHLRDWTFRLLVDAGAKRERHLRPMVEPGKVSLSVGNMEAIVGLRTDRLQEDRMDPVFCLFHELGHVAAHGMLVTDPDQKFVDLWDQEANRFAALLWDIWQAEGIGRT